MVNGGGQGLLELEKNQEFGRSPKETKKKRRFGGHLKYRSGWSSSLSDVNPLPFNGPGACNYQRSYFLVRNILDSDMDNVKLVKNIWLTNIYLVAMNIQGCYKSKMGSLRHKNM